jgi:site-specific DNA recombinase
MTSARGLRFAPLIRVSTETQERKGESLRTQEKQIRQAVSSMGGMIPDNCWKYSGQEHATIGQERKKLEKLLDDSGKGLFDAVIVADASRWSRDNMRSKQGLELLKKNGVRFFVGTMEYDLFSPEQSFFLGMATEINEFQSKIQTQKSLLNRIERAKRGIPTGGKIPYGRTFDRKTGTWGLDEEKVKGIRWAAEQYLANKMTIPEIAKVLGMNFTNLWKILTRRSGDKWQIEFKSEKLNIDETVEIKIPPLLPEHVIEKIRERAELNKTYHGTPKHRYLLSHRVMCEECGYALFGQVNRSGKRYYRHAGERANPCSIGRNAYVPADELETAVMAHLFNLFGDAPAMEKAIEKAFPNMEEVRRLEEQLKVLEKKLGKVKQGKENIIDMIAEGTVTKDEVKAKMSKLREREGLLQNEVEELTARIASVPSRERVTRDANSLAARFRKRAIKGRYSDRDHFLKMPFDSQRRLVEHALSGRDSNGKKHGVYVERTEEGWAFTIRGVLLNQTGIIDMSQEERDMLIGEEMGPDDVIDPDRVKYAWHLQGLDLPLRRSP